MKSFPDCFKKFLSSNSFKSWTANMNISKRLKYVHSMLAWGGRYPSSVARYLLGVTRKLPRSIIEYVIPVVEAGMKRKIIRGWNPYELEALQRTTNELGH